MQAPEVARVPATQRAVATYTAAMIHALAREEQRERRPKRLLEPDMATWKRFRGWLELRDLVELLLEDAAITQPLPFDAPRVLQTEQPMRLVPQANVGDWIGGLTAVDLGAAGPDYLLAQAKRFGIATKMARAELHKIKPHHRVLELPGTGGQLTFHMVSTQEGIYLQDSFTIACGTWEELTLAGLVAVELGLTGELPIGLDPKLEKAFGRREEFHYVVGLSPDKGGMFETDYLRERFPHATVVLV